MPKQRGQFYMMGYEEGQSASYDTDWQPGEMQEKYEADELGEVVGQILEHWQQMAGTIYYDDAVSSSQLDKFEEGFFDGFVVGVKGQLRVKKQKPYKIRRSINPRRRRR